MSGESSSHGLNEFKKQINKQNNVQMGIELLAHQANCMQHFSVLQQTIFDILFIYRDIFA